MVDRILNVKNVSELLQVSKELVAPSGRTQLYKGVSASKYVLLADDLWTEEFIDYTVSTANGIETALKTTESEQSSVKLLHRLQLIAHCNPGVKRHILQYIHNACI